jgi:hypothetical protein
MWLEASLFPPIYTVLAVIGILVRACGVTSVDMVALVHRLQRYEGYFKMRLLSASEKPRFISWQHT